MIKFFPVNKKGMEMWQLVLIIIAVVFLVFMLMWYGGLGDDIKNLLDRFLNFL